MAAAATKRELVTIAKAIESSFHNGMWSLSEFLTYHTDGGTCLETQHFEVLNCEFRGLASAHPMATPSSYMPESMRLNEKGKYESYRTGIWIPPNTKLGRDRSSGLLTANGSPMHQITWGIPMVPGSDTVKRVSKFADYENHRGWM